MIERRSRAKRGDGNSDSGFLWRSPLKFRHAVRAKAKSIGLTANAYITYALIVEAIVLHTPAPPRAAFAGLIREMNDAIDGGEVVLGDCPEADWDHLRQLVGELQDAGIIDGLKVRRNGQSSVKTYSFYFTPEGRDVWPRVAPRI